jgi:cytochrome P450
MASKLPPGPRNPRVVNTFRWMVKPAALFESAQARYGDVWTLRMLRQTTFVVVSDPDLIKDVFTADPTVLHAGHANLTIGTSLLGKYSVLTLDEHDHTVQRKLLLPQFGSERVARYHDVMARICEEDLATWPLNEPIELLPRMQAITRKVIMSAIFGVTGGEEQDRLDTRIANLLEWGAHPLNMTRLHRASKRDSKLPSGFVERRDPLEEAVYQAIEGARQDPRLEERDDILAMLVQARHDDGTPMSDVELRDEMVTLLIQGHASTATALSWALERLLRHPETLERLRAELEGGDDAYLDAVLKETLRVRPTNPVVIRYVNKPFRLGNYDLDVGTMVAPCIYLLHRRPDLYPEPERFRPERFLEQPAGPYTWIPFGGGDRHCIGRNFATSEIETVLRILVLRARLEPVEQPDESIRKRGILLSPSDSARAVLRERLPAAATVSVTG